ncbi:hypothetical protein [Leptospira bandrabouensis]|uniref:Tetratricopeptide repeat protein n=1 Tax=Leptospira bandrabouensis TaxID=2484903 RepID=A0A6H3NWF3_9LEPT|nr:hypothetical protein [Leptospira bandrabouensis]MCG6143553.1 hypothetical protein [Leptospira bandrabouensis]MCG6151404.1 hypothetical protein [Leptospira bandrabouensis]MCG6159213.1 hypothetical protein [Leptospira bandrabouensis]MCG6163147.1 hypothetical protein [Leptospira bandrabouensis]TGN04821.1 hypothetical protein EHR07_09365 [Leptospira bandrabouensis]
MDSKERAALIREANTAFNAGDIRKARELFLKTDYKDGLIRLGDHFMYDRKLPMLAFGYYKKAGRQDKVDEIFQRMIYGLSVWLGRDKWKLPTSANQAESTETKTSTPLNPDDFVVHPILKAKALEILSSNR